jgi:hypothetical protein
MKNKIIGCFVKRKSYSKKSLETIGFLPERRKNSRGNNLDSFRKWAHSFYKNIVQDTHSLVVIPKIDESHREGARLMAQIHDGKCPICNRLMDLPEDAPDAWYCKNCDVYWLSIDSVNWKAVQADPRG